MLYMYMYFCFYLNKYKTDVTDVCLDENAVSSDPVLAFLLDEVVVKDWCKRSFAHLVRKMRIICILTLLSFLINIFNQGPFAYISV